MLTVGLSALACSSWSCGAKVARDPNAPCDPTADFGEPVAIVDVAGLDGIYAVGRASLTADELSVYFTAAHGDPKAPLVDTYTMSRRSLSDTFSNLMRVPGLPDDALPPGPPALSRSTFHDAFISSDGLRLIAMYGPNPPGDAFRMAERASRDEPFGPWRIAAGLEDLEHSYNLSAPEFSRDNSLLYFGADVATEQRAWDGVRFSGRTFVTGLDGYLGISSGSNLVWYSGASGVMRRTSVDAHFGNPSGKINGLLAWVSPNDCRSYGFRYNTGAKLYVAERR